jgi:hypothetical protein
LGCAVPSYLCLLRVGEEANQRREEEDKEEEKHNKKEIKDERKEEGGGAGIKEADADEARGRGRIFLSLLDGWIVIFVPDHHFTRYKCGDIYT